MVPTHSNSDISKQPLVGLKRELVNFMEDLYFLRYIFLLYFSTSISKPQIALISLMSRYRTRHHLKQEPQPSHCSTKVILFLGRAQRWLEAIKVLIIILHVNPNKQLQKKDIEGICQVTSPLHETRASAKIFGTPREGDFSSALLFLQNIPRSPGAQLGEASLVYALWSPGPAARYRRGIILMWKADEA